MGYKRTSKKTSAFGRRTQTINNTNGSITNSNSTGNKYNRTTYSNNSKTGNKIIHTWRDGAGFTHKKTVYSTAGAERERKRQQKQSAKFWASLFGTNKKKRVNKRTDNRTANSSSLGNWIVFGIICFIVYQFVK